MSMIEKFLENKNVMCKTLDEIRERALKAAEPEADVVIEKFITDVKGLVAEATDEEFVEFITSGKLEDDDIAAAIMFRAEAAKENDELQKKSDEKRGHRVHVFVLK